MTSPTTVRTAVMAAIEQTVLEDRPLPPLRPTDVLVEVRSVGVCGSDVHWYRDGHIGQTWVRDPLVLGHELSGIIVAAGSSRNQSRIGERVAVEPGIPCGRCHECRAGRYNLCPDVRFFATPPVDGAFATHIAIDADFAHPVPDDLDDDEAALIEPLAVALWATRKAHVGLGDRVLITGAGPIGLLVLQVAKAAGAVVGVRDVSAERLRVAAELGADHVNDAGDDVAVPYTVLLECSGSPQAIANGVRSLAAAGRAVLIGMAAGGSATIPLDVLQSREITLTGTFRYANQFPDAIALAASGRIELRRLVTSIHPLTDVHGALMASSRDRDTLKPMVHPQQSEIPPA